VNLAVADRATPIRHPQIDPGPSLFGAVSPGEEIAFLDPSRGDHLNLIKEEGIWEHLHNDSPNRWSTRRWH
jgi:hypothetical protein